MCTDGGEIIAAILSNSSLEGWEIALGLGVALTFGAGTHPQHLHPCQHPNISGVLPPFHHPSSGLGFTSMVVLWLPGVTRLP